MFFNKQNVSYGHWRLSQYQENLEAIKSLRKNYSHFPYLYAYDEKEENEYHEAYMSAGSSLDAFVATYEGELVAISIGCPLIPSVSICTDLVGTEFNTGNTYYFGDIIVSKEFWGRGLADQLYQRHIEYVKSKQYSNILALLVEREPNDPRKPSHFQKSKLWDRHRFYQTPITVDYPWNTIDKDGGFSEQNNTLRAFNRVL